MIDEDMKNAIIKEIEKEYFLIPKHSWIMFLGGALGFMILATYSSYTGAMSAIKSQWPKNNR
jgi:hypothetical protein